MATLANLIVNITGRTIEFEKSLGRVEKRLNYYGRQFQRSGRRITTGFSAPLFLAGVASAKMAVDFEESMSKIVGLVGIGSDQVNAWQNDILSLSKEVGKAPKELAKAMFFITSAGLRGKVALEALKDTAKASTAGLGDMTAIADAVTSAINAYGVETLNSATATGVLVAAIREGKLESESLAPALGQILPISSELGVSFGEVAGAVAAMSRLGLNASESVTALRGVMVALLKPAEKAQKTLKERLNLTFAQLRSILKEQGLVQLLMTLKEAFKGNEDAVARVFPRVEGLVGLLNLIGANADQAKQIINSVSRATGDDLNNAFDVASKTAKFKLNVAISQLNAQMVRLGVEVLPIVIPVVSAFVDKVGGLFERLNALSPAFKKIVVYVGLFAVALGPVIWAIGTLITSVGAIFAFTKSILNLGRVAALTFGPMIAAVGLMVTAIVMWYTKWEEIKSGLVVIWDFLKEKFISTWNSMLNGLINAINAIRLLPQRIKQFVISSLQWWKILETESKTSVNNTVTTVVKKTQTMAKASSQALSTSSAAMRIVAERYRAASEMIGQGTNIVIDKIDHLENRIKSMREVTASSIGDITAQLMRSKKSFGDWMKDVIRSITAVILKIKILQAVSSELISPMGGAFLTGFVGGLFRASGGSVASNRPYIVGERGPELFVPSVSGNIIPNSKLAGVGLGGGITINNSINVSGMDLGDKQAIKNIMQGLSDQIAQKTAIAINFAKETYRKGKDRNNET